MNRKPISTKTAGTSIVAALALLAPAVAHAGPGGSVAPTASLVLGWLDVAVGAAFLVGVVLVGLYGDRLVGAIVTGVIELPPAGARLAGRIARSSAGAFGRAQTPIVTGSSRSSSPS